MNHWALIFLCSLAFLACNDDDSSMSLSSDAGVPDAGQQQMDDANISDAGSVLSDAARVSDAGSETRPDVSTTLDGTVDITDGVIEEVDAAVSQAQDVGLIEFDQGIVMDAAIPQMARRSAGQCGDDDDCPNGVNGRNCSRALPGGTCLGCGTDLDCPSDAECNFGSCVVPCTNDQDCAPGLSCLSRGRCGAAACVDGQCPDPRFDCSDGDRCTRRVCASSGDCGAGTECVNGLCIEAHWL